MIRVEDHHPAVLVPCLLLLVRNGPFKLIDARGVSEGFLGTLAVLAATMLVVAPWSSVRFGQKPFELSRYSFFTCG